MGGRTRAQTCTRPDALSMAMTGRMKEPKVLKTYDILRLETNVNVLSVNAAHLQSTNELFMAANVPGGLIKLIRLMN